MNKLVFQSKKRLIIIICDLLVIPAMFFCEALSDFMLSQESVCTWVKLGGQCPTCGGTHFVNYLLNGRISDAFESNQLLFVFAIFLAVSYVFLNLFLIWDFDFAKKVLLKMYSIPSVIIWVVALFVFTVLRNLKPLSIVFLILGRLFTLLLNRLFG